MERETTMISPIDCSGAINYAPVLNFTGSKTPKQKTDESETKQKDKNLAKEIALVASAVGAVAVAGIILAKKGVFDPKTTEKFSEAMQGDKTVNAIESAICDDKVVQSTPLDKSKRFVKFPDGSYKNFDKNGVLRFEKTADGVVSWYDKDGKLICRGSRDNGFLYGKNGNVISSDGEIVYHPEKYIQTHPEAYTEDGKLILLSNEEGTKRMLIPTDSHDIIYENNGKRFSSFPDDILISDYERQMAHLFNLEGWGATIRHRVAEIAGADSDYHIHLSTSKFISLWYSEALKLLDEVFEKISA